MITEHAIRTEWGKVSYCLQPSGKQTILFLHGLPLDKDIWREVQMSLSPDFASIAIDLPGFGQSSPLPRSAGHLESFSHVVELVVKDLCLQKPILFAHSMGGYVLLEVLKRNKIALGGFVFCASRCTKDPEWKRIERRNFADILESGDVEIFLNNQTPNLQNASVQVIDSIQRMIRRNISEFLPGLLRELADRPTRCGVLKQSSLPSLYLVGDLDRAFRDDVAYAAQTQGGTDVSIIPHAGHFLFVENPEAFLLSVRNWLTSIQ